MTTRRCRYLACLTPDVLLVVDAPGTRNRWYHPACQLHKIRVRQLGYRRRNGIGPRVGFPHGYGHGAVDMSDDPAMIEATFQAALREIRHRRREV